MLFIVVMISSTSVSTTTTTTYSSYNARVPPPRNDRPRHGPQGQARRITDTRHDAVSAARQARAQVVRWASRSSSLASPAADASQANNTRHTSNMHTEAADTCRLCRAHRPNRGDRGWRGAEQHPAHGRERRRRREMPAGVCGERARVSRRGPGAARRVGRDETKGLIADTAATPSACSPRMDVTRSRRAVRRRACSPAWGRSLPRWVGLEEGGKGDELTFP